MNLVKLPLVAAAAAFTISCGEVPPTPTSNAVANAKNSSVIVAAVTPQTQNRPAINADQKKRLQQVAAVAELDEPITDDIYAANCMICHKDTGKGGKVSISGKTLNADDLTSEKMKKHSDDELFKRISDGVPDEGMPAFKGKLSDDQIRSVVAQVRGLQSK